MREIKFRAWDKMDLKMCKVLEIDFPNEEGSGIVTDYKLGSFERYELMQFTGLKDKNGVEIYEGDILATSNANPEYDIWTKEDNGYVSVYWNDETVGFNCKGNWTPELGGEDESIYSMNFVEVIGNIYESPELLK